MSLVAPIVAGVVAGGGLTLVVAHLLPSPPPELRSAVQRLNSPLREATPVASDPRLAPGAKGRSILPEPLLTWLQGSGLVLASPEDLAILGKNATTHSAEKIGMGVLGLLLPAALTLFLVALKIHISLAIPIGIALLVGAVCFFGPDLEIRGRARSARAEFLKVLHAYLINVALERRANLGIVQAMTEAATVGDSWVLQRIRATLLASQMSNTTPWRALEELGTELGVMHLVEAAQTLRSASQEGTAVFQRLVAQADSLGDAVLTEEKAVANARSERMVIPVTLMGIVIMIMMAYPAVVELARVR
ncbi:hypothetical protein GCM10009839_14910 [Catenulispora yoronensis]|uniref:Type II secretion system protein GspF domain-containing protein n=1 Tax=Catenulispora yoronensis TaxID=450799 RepID=A0ABN2TS62_9ACTN